MELRKSRYQVSHTRPVFLTLRVCFLCPDVTVSDRGNVLMSPEQCVFSLGSIDLLAEDEEEDIFNP